MIEHPKNFDVIIIPTQKIPAINVFMIYISFIFSKVNNIVDDGVEINADTFTKIRNTAI